MKAKVEIVYEDESQNKRLEIELLAKIKPGRVLDAIDEAVNDQMRDDPNWQRWKLLGITDNEADPPPASRAKRTKAKPKAKKKR